MRKYFILIMLMCAGRCYSQSMLRVQHLNVEDGLSQSSVYSIFQDSYGFIWMATGDGLNRYDGKEFIAYKSKLTDLGALQHRDRNINSIIFEDCYHNFWYSADEGVYCMERKTGKASVYVNRHAAGYASQIAGIDSDLVWAIITGKGVYKINAGSKAIGLYPFGDTFQAVKNTLCPVVNASINTPGGLWIADAMGLIWFDKKTMRDQRKLVKAGINNIHALRDGRLLLSMLNGVVIYDPLKGTEHLIRIADPERRDLLWYSMAEDTLSGTVYMNERNSGLIARLDLAIESYEPLNFTDNSIIRLFIDHSRNLWAGTDGGGVYRMDIKPAKFSCYAPVTTDKGGFMIKSIFRDDSGRLWLGVYGKGVTIYDPATKKAILLPCCVAPAGAYCGCIVRDSSGEVIVTVNDKVIWIDPKTLAKKKEVVIPFETRLSRERPVIYSIAEWKRGHYLVASNVVTYSMREINGRMCAVAEKRVIGDSMINAWTYNISKGAVNDIYVGKRNGFAKIRMLSDSVPQFIDGWNNGLPVRHFYKSISTPILWMATEQGLIAYNEKTRTCQLFDEATGLANSYVYAILPQNDSVLWVSTNKGLSRVAVHYGKDNVNASFTNYSSKDGLQSNEFNTGAFYKSSDGVMMFGGIAGVNWFDPARIVPNTCKAMPAITGVYIDDTLVTRDTAMYVRGLVLPYNRNTVSLIFKSLEYTQPEQNTYAYKLDELDKEWIYTANDRVRYAKLAPGEYRFLLKVSNNEGVWNDKPLELMITITPPYWQTWWFRLLVVLAAGSVIAGITKYYTHQKVRTKTRALEKQHALNMERLRISKDVHDDIGSGLSKISLLSAMASRKIKDNQLPGKDIGSISAISKELVDNMRDLIWVLNPENTTLDNLLSRIREYCSDYLEGIEIDARVTFPQEVPAINISREVQRNIFSTVKEAVNNCVKHANATGIVIAAAIANDALVITITDNGDGFRMGETRSGGNGLRNMKQRIESVGGAFRILPQEPHGTEILITVPLYMLNNEHAVSDD